MKAKPVMPRALASQDVEGVINYYLDQQAEQAALGFIDALKSPIYISAAIRPRVCLATPTSWICRGCFAGR